MPALETLFHRSSNTIEVHLDHSSNALKLVDSESSAPNARGGDSHSVIQGPDLRL